MSTQHQQLLTTLEDIAKTQAEKHFAHPIHCDKTSQGDIGSRIAYKHEEGFNAYDDFVIINAYPCSLTFVWQLSKDNVEYSGWLYIEKNCDGNFYLQDYTEFYNSQPCTKEQNWYPIFADFRNALKSIEQLLSEELPCAA